MKRSKEIPTAESAEVTPPEQVLETAASKATPLESVLENPEAFVGQAAQSGLEDGEKRLLFDEIKSDLWRVKSQSERDIFQARLRLHTAREKLVGLEAAKQDDWRNARSPEIDALEDRRVKAEAAYNTIEKARKAGARPKAEKEIETTENQPGAEAVARAREAEALKAVTRSMAGLEAPLKNLSRTLARREDDGLDEILDRGSAGMLSRSSDLFAALLAKDKLSGSETAELVETINRIVRVFGRASDSGARGLTRENMDSLRQLSSAARDIIPSVQAALANVSGNDSRQFESLKGPLSGLLTNVDAFEYSVRRKMNAFDRYHAS